MTAPGLRVPSPSARRAASGHVPACLGRALLGMMLLATAVLAGCAATPTTRFYTLGAPAETRPSGAGNAAPRLQVDVATVVVPERLARPQLVVRPAGEPPSARVEILDQSRWTSPFDAELRDAIGAAVAVRTGGTDVTGGGRMPGLPLYRIALNVRQFDAIAGTRVDATVGWTVSRSGDDRSVTCDTRFVEHVDSADGAARSRDATDHDALVLAVRRIVAGLSDRIADQVTRLEAGQPALCAPARS